MCWGMGAGVGGGAHYSEFSIKARQEWRRERETVTGKGGRRGEQEREEGRRQGNRARAPSGRCTWLTSSVSIAHCVTEPHESCTL